MNRNVFGKYTGPTEDDLPLTVRQARINTPALIILLGSTASISALELMRHMLTLQPADQRKVAMVYIDTDEPNSSVVEFRQYHNGVFQEFPLRIAVPVGISEVDRVPQDMGLARDNLARPLEPHTFIRGKEPQYFSNGAGGIRNNGHVAACFHHQSIYDTLERALASIMHVDMRQNAQRRNEVQAYLVTFMGGGTGSGIIADVTVMLRELLARQQYEQRINLFCMLPEPIKGASLTDLSWRKSNTMACLLELTAYSLAAGATPGYRYQKLMREKKYYLTNDAIANEVFLLGQTAMDDPSGTARLVGLDLFQRITDSSGVGYLEHSKQVDRRTLGETDDRGLPTMFGTSCSLEVRFPAEETIMAFARLSAANSLPLLAAYKPRSIAVDDRTRLDWVRKWLEVAPIDVNPSNPRAIKPGQMRFDEFEEADQTRLNILWTKVERYERETEQRIKEAIEQKETEELRRINEMPRAQVQGGMSVLNSRIQHLQMLLEEYTVALEAFNERKAPRLFPRPVELEAELTQPSRSWFSRFRDTSRERAYDVFSAYNGHMHVHANVTRHTQLKRILEELQHYVRESLNSAQSWFKGTDMEERMQELETRALTSMAWLGRLDYPHPHQRHIFDLRTLRSSDGRNIAVERLYLWATGGEKVLNDGAPLETSYADFVDECVDFLGRKMSEAQGANKADPGRLEDQNAGRLADRVVDYFREVYTKKFEDMNLFELLDKAAPPSSKGQVRSQQMSTYLLEHLQHIRGLMSSLIAFEAELWGQGQGNLETSIFLGTHWRDGYQQGMLDQALDKLGALTKRGQQPAVQLDFDPHRLQASYGQHAISLATIRDFYLEQNSSMEAYTYHQGRWDSNGGVTPQGYMPTHSSQETQRLVTEDLALVPAQAPAQGQGKAAQVQAKALYKRLIRQPGGARP